MSTTETTGTNKGGKTTAATAIMREKVLLVGDSSTSKTVSLLGLALLYPDNKVVILDPDDGTSKAIGEMGLEPKDLPNLTIIPVRADWDKMMESYREQKETLTPNDWLCFDMLGRFWDMAQTYYSRRVFGEDPVEHILRLREQAKKVSFGGFDGLQDWSLIKRLHNELLLDDAVVNSEFNVMATTSVGQYLPIEKLPKKGVMGILASEFKVKPEGEKHNIFRFDTVAVLYQEPIGTYGFSLVKDKGRAVDVSRVFDITGRSFWECYREYRNQQGTNIL